MFEEASVVASLGGDFFYAIWDQEMLDRRDNVIASDAWFRWVMYLDESEEDGGGGEDPSPEPVPVLVPAPGKKR